MEATNVRGYLYVRTRTSENPLISSASRKSLANRVPQSFENRVAREVACELSTPKDPGVICGSRRRHP